MEVYMKKDRVEKYKIKKNNVRRKIYIRTISALMIAYLVLMAGLSVLTFNQQSKYENNHYYQWLLRINDTVDRILKDNIDSNYKIKDINKFEDDCNGYLLGLPYLGIELTIFTNDFDIIYTTDPKTVNNNEVQNELLKMVSDKDRLQKQINKDHDCSVNRLSLVTARYYCTVPYIYGKTSNDSYPFWIVLGAQQNFLNKCIDTLLYIWISCFVLFMAVALILSNQNYKIYQKKAELDKLRSETTNALAHDLKTPLSIISGYAQNLIENIHTEKRDYYAININANVNRMDRIIREMLELSRYDTDFNKLVYEDVSLRKVCAKLIDRYSQVCKEREITVSLEGDAIVKAEFSLMERVIDNFFVNAMEFTPDTGMIHIRILESSLEFYNSGSHISEDLIDQIWEPYKKADDSRSNNKGSGLGLSISSKILNLYRFSYGAKNIDGGVTFWIKW
jgi:signal transduction histidine kinase